MKPIEGNTERAIYAFIYGLKGPRQNGVTLKQIETRFSNVAGNGVSLCLHSLICSGHVLQLAKSLSSHRRHSGAYEYVATVNERGPATL